MVMVVAVREETNHVGAVDQRVLPQCHERSSNVVKVQESTKLQGEIKRLEACPGPLPATAVAPAHAEAHAVACAPDARSLARCPCPSPAPPRPAARRRRSWLLRRLRR